MAVPGSGSLSLAAIAAEKLENDYTDVDTSYGPYSLKEITQGGGTENYDVTNQQSPNHPDNVAALVWGSSMLMIMIFKLYHVVKQWMLFFY